MVYCGEPTVQRKLEEQHKTLQNFTVHISLEEHQDMSYEDSSDAS